MFSALSSQRKTRTPPLGPAHVEGCKSLNRPRLRGCRHSSPNKVHRIDLDRSQSSDNLGTRLHARPTLRRRQPSMRCYRSHRHSRIPAHIPAYMLLDGARRLRVKVGRDHIPRRWRSTRRDHSPRWCGRPQVRHKRAGHEHSECNPEAHRSWSIRRHHRVAAHKRPHDSRRIHLSTHKCSLPAQARRDDWSTP